MDKKIKNENWQCDLCGKPEDTLFYHKTADGKTNEICRTCRKNIREGKIYEASK